MSQTHEAVDVAVRPIIGELSEFYYDMPLDDEEEATLFKMIRSANAPIDDKNMRTIALLAVAKTQKDHSHGLSPDALQDEATAKMLVIMRYLKAVREDITSEALYNPVAQLWLLETTFNDHVTKLIMEALQQMAQNERALLSSGSFPNRDLLEGTVELAIKARNSCLDLPGWSYFCMVDEQVEDLLYAIVGDHKSECEGWADDIKIFVQLAFNLSLSNLTARQYHGIKRAIGKARLSRERAMNPNGSELSLWTVGDETSADDLETSLESTQTLINGYFEEAKDELAKELWQEMADINGISTHELTITGVEQQRR